MGNDLHGAPSDIQRKTRLQDSNRTLIFAFIIVAVWTSLLAVVTSRSMRVWSYCTASSPLASTQWSWP